MKHMIDVEVLVTHRKTLEVEAEDTATAADQALKLANNTKMQQWQVAKTSPPKVAKIVRLRWEEVHRIGRKRKAKEQPPSKE